MANFPITDVEEVKRQVRLCLLSQDFNQVLDELYALKRDGLEVRYPVEVYTSQMFNPQVFPCAEVTCAISRNNSQDSGAKDLTHDIGIFWHDRDGNEEELDRRIIRYLTATREFFVRFPYVNMITATPVLIGDDNYSPFVPVSEFEGRPFIKSGLINIYVRTIG